MTGPDSIPARPSPETVAAPDGRTLAYAEYGTPEGWPVFCFHGTPGSRILWSAFDDVAIDRDVRLIAPERPGFGASSFAHGRTILDWTDDVGALADALDVDKFALVGFSGGGAFAAACTAEIPERLRDVALVSSVTPPAVQSEYATAGERASRWALRTVPGASRGLFGLASLFADHWPSRLRATLLADACERDQALFDGPGGDLLLSDAAEAFADGGRGVAHEYPLLGADWGFDPAEMTGHVSLWHGENDGTIPVERARETDRRVPDADLTVVADGHYSTLLRNRDAILRDVVP